MDLMKRLFVMALLATTLALLSGSAAEAQVNSYICEFSGTATVKNGTLTNIHISQLECE